METAEMSTEKKKNIAPIAAKNTSEADPLEQTVNDPVVPEVSTQADIPESLEQILSTIPQEQIELVNKMVPGLIPYLSIQEQKVNFLIENMPTKEGVTEAFKQVVAQQSQITNPGQIPQGGGGVAGLLPLLMQALGTGGGQDNQYAELGKKMAEAQFERMMRGNAFLDNLENYFFSALGAKTGKKMVDAVSEAAGI